MKGIWPVEEVRAAEADTMAVLPEGALMARAAAGLAAYAVSRLRRTYGARVVILAGSGNNGGDALYAGARLARRGADVRALLLGTAHAGGLADLLAAGGQVRPAVRAEVADAELVLDGIVGIGGHGGLRGDAAVLVEAAYDAGAVIVAVDVPSGVDADTGAVAADAVDADATVTFGCLKPGLLLGRGAAYSGAVVLVDIGLTAALPEPTLRLPTDLDLDRLLPVPRSDDDKYSRGVLGVVAGSSAYGGAAVMCVGGALRTGAGMVRYVGGAADGVRSRWPEVVVAEGAPSDAGRVQAWAVGPGLGTGEAAEELLADVLGTDVPVLVDADGLTVLGRSAELQDQLARRTAPTVLTPHDREFARVASDRAVDLLDDDRLGGARLGARELGVTMLLKGDATIVAAPDGRAYVNPTGTPWLAAAGTGDVLSGCVGALLAASAADSTGSAALDVTSAAVCGAYLHGVAGQLASAGAPLTAVDVLDRLPEAIRRVRGHTVER